MGRKGKNRMKAVNDVNAYLRGPVAVGKSKAPDASDLIPSDLAPVFSQTLSNLPADTGSIRKPKRTEKKKKRERPADEEREDKEERSTRMPVPQPRKEKSEGKGTPAVILPGESYAAFARRVNKEASEKLQQVDISLQKPLQQRKKEYLQKKKLKKKKGKKSEEDEGPDFVHTDKVRFGEVAQAPPKLTPPAFKKKKVEHVERAPARESGLPPEMEKLRQKYIEAYRTSRALERTKQSAAK